MAKKMKIGDIFGVGYNTDFYKIRKIYPETVIAKKIEPYEYGLVEVFKKDIKQIKKKKQIV